MSGLAIAAMCPLNLVSPINGFCAIQKQKKHWPSCAITLSVSFQRTGRRFTHSGWRTFATGASAGRCGGDTGYRHGTEKENPRSEIRNPKFTWTLSLRLIRRTGSRMKTRSTPGFRRGFGRTRRWIKRQGRNSIRRACL